MNILFTCAGRRSYLLQYFREALGGKGLIIGADMQLTAPALAFADIGLEVPPVYAPEYIEVLQAICVSRKIDLLIPLNDLELPILASKLDAFEKIGTRVLVSSIDVIETGFDKLKTVAFAKSIGMKTPKTYRDLNSARSAIDSGELRFPVVVKPRWGSASIGIEFPESMEELELCYALSAKKLMRSILKHASSGDTDAAILIQEKLPGKEFGVDVLNHFDKKPRAVYVKEKLAMRAGETDKSVLRQNVALEEAGWLIGERLGHIGNIDCDFFADEDDVYLLEINPRFGGGYPFTHESGGNYVKAILSWMEGQDLDCASFSRAYGQVFSKCDSLVKIEK